MNRKFIIGGVVACACLGAAAPAGAVPVPLTFDHVVLDTPSTPKAQIVSDRTQPLKVTADVDPITGDFTVQPSDFSLPTYSFSSPVAGTVTISLKNPATGTANFATGALTLNADLLATITLQGYGSCIKDTGPITLSTATTQPLPGKNFPAGASGVATGPGAFGYGWTSLAPGTGSACPLVNPVVAGKGGIWVSRGISPEPPAVKATTKAPKRTRPGRTALVKVTVTNTGGDDTSPIRACLADPKPLAPKSSCKTIKTLAGGKSSTLTYRVKTNKRKRGHYTLKLRVSGRGISTVSRKIKLTVR